MRNAKITAALVLGLFTVLLIAVGILLLKDAAYFRFDKADRFVERSKEVTDIDERHAWAIEAAECRSIAAFDAAIAAACFAFCGLSVGWTRFIFDILETKKRTVRE